MAFRDYSATDLFLFYIADLAFLLTMYLAFREPGGSLPLIHKPAIGPDLEQGFPGSYPELKW